VRDQNSLLSEKGERMIHTNSPLYYRLGWTNSECRTWRGKGNKIGFIFTCIHKVYYLTLTPRYFLSWWKEEIKSNRNLDSGRGSTMIKMD
jgi:hypothetical protein